MQEIVVSRPRDGCDRVTWLLEHSRFEQALEIIETDTTLTQSMREQASFLQADSAAVLLMLLCILKNMTYSARMNCI